MKHTIDIEEIKDFTFERDLCSMTTTQGFRKRLVVYVSPYENHMHYKVYLADVCVVRCNNMEGALNEYNNI